MRFANYCFIAALFCFACLINVSAQAALLTIENCTGKCAFTDDPPNPIAKNPNNETLLSWDEQQNVLLTKDLQIDVVADITSSVIRKKGNKYYIKAGTMVSSHMLQWDNGDEPGNKRKNVYADIFFDSAIFGVIKSDKLLNKTDELFGLVGYDYHKFRARGLEKRDTYSFNGNQASMGFYATSPGDWTRVITAYSPFSASNQEVTDVPTPAMAGLLLIGIWAMRRRM